MKRICVIGAGIAGLTLARRLAGLADVTVFEKSRGVGGRMATRRVDDFEFDHGAQFFTARSKAFQAFLEPLADKGLVEQWHPRVLTLAAGEKPYRRDWFEPHYVAVPTMTALCKTLAAEQSILLNTQITGLTAVGNTWQVNHESDIPGEDFDWVISSAPYPQTLSLLSPHMTSAVLESNSASLSACYTLMLGFRTDLPFTWQAARIKHAAIDWITQNQSKPGRADSTTLVIHSTADWAQQHLETDKQQVQQQLITALESILGITLPTPATISLHCWRYARVEQACEDNYLLDADNQLAACGDWCIDARVEAAWQSANALADRLEPML